MEEEITLNGKPAVKIFATHVKTYDKMYLLDCEGDREFFPIKCVKLNREEGTAIIEEWIYNKKFNQLPNDINDY